MNSNEIQPLSNQEVQELDVSAALRKIGDLDRALYEVQPALKQALIKLSESRLQYEIAKAQKDLIVERARNLKTFVKHS